MEVPVESLGNLLDRLKMSEQPSTSRTVSNDMATVEPPAITPTMFAGVPSVPTSSQPLEGVRPGTVSTVWSVPVCSSGIISGNSYVETRQIDPFEGQFGQSSPQGQTIPLSSGLPPYGGQYALSLTPPREDIQTGVHNSIQVILELHQVVGYLCYLNNQGLYILCNSVYLCRTSRPHRLLWQCRMFKCCLLYVNLRFLRL